MNCHGTNIIKNQWQGPFHKPCAPDNFRADVLRNFQKQCTSVKTVRLRQQLGSEFNLTWRTKLEPAELSPGSKRPWGTCYEGRLMALKLPIIIKRNNAYNLAHSNVYQEPLPVPCLTRCRFATRLRKCSFNVFRLAPVTRSISPIVTRPC